MVTKKPTNYRSLSAELDAILTDLQSGELDIDKAVTQYQRGMAIVEELQKYLKDAQNTVTKVKANFST